MDTDRLKQLDQLVDGALALPPEARAAWLAEACPDPELRREAESLLAGESRPPSALERPPWPLLDAQLGMRSGDRVGPYRVVEELGRGGMGVVYLAERADDEYERRVALKVLKRGLDSEEIVRRFRTERQILANLKHPGIAELYEGGSTDDGLPYFVMEHVEGERIDLYCDGRRLSVRERLALFRKVCASVQLAHQSLVVHRDLKPGNILVTAEGQPKLLDFGIAKLLDPRSQEPITLTEDGARPMTPEYASPEQVSFEPITVATDVYALGVLLYELLTGRRPYRLGSGSSPEKLRRAICEEEPTKPSAAVARAPEDRARTLGETVKSLSRRLQGDLDNIVLKALAKDPRLRYASVEQFSEDVRRHLEGLPVRAHKPTLAYRAGKFLRRNGKKVAAAVVALGLLTGFLIDRELQQRRVARALERAERVTDFLIELFEVSDPSEARGNTITAREVLDRGAERIREELQEEPETQAALMQTMGRVYGNLGLYKEATSLVQRALDLRVQIYGEKHTDVAESLAELATLTWRQGDYANTEQRLRKLLALLTELVGTEDPETASVINNLGVLMAETGDYAASEAFFREALAIRRKVLPEDHPDLVESLGNIATFHMFQGDYEEAEVLVREALALDRQRLGPEHPRVINDLYNLASLLRVRGSEEAAGPIFREGLELSRRIFGEEHPVTAKGYHNLATSLHSQGQFDEAESYYRQALALREKLLGQEHPEVARTQDALVVLLTDRGDARAALPLAQEVLSMRRKLLGTEHPDVARSLHNIATIYKDLGEIVQAGTFYRQALVMRRELLGAGHPDVGISLSALASVLIVAEDYTEAESLLTEAMDVFKGRLAEDHWRIADAENLMGRCLSGRGRYEEAEPILVGTYQRILAQMGPRMRPTRQAVKSLVELYEAWGKPDKAAEYRQLLDSP